MAGYRLAPDYGQNYDSRYGNGLNGPSRTKIEETVRFLFTIEALERHGNEIALHISTRPVSGFHSPIHHLAWTCADGSGDGAIFPCHAAERASNDSDTGTVRDDHSHAGRGAEHQAQCFA